MTARSVAGSVPYDSGRQTAPIRQAHGDLPGFAYHMIVGENIAIRGDDNAGTGPGLFRGSL